MTCWHCDDELKFDAQTANSFKLYHCEGCDKWYEMRKDEAKVNGAVPVRFYELDSRPQMQAAAV